ncbi:MAG: DUF2971 domain-containing protein [Pseudomonadota bacterium]|nr:DUF2971 domain-containing protein [Pseudomonadota bacterium]
MNEFLYQELELSEVFAASPQHLNDPFDCQIDPQAAIKRASRRVKDADRLALFREMSDNFSAQPPVLKRKGISCFSKHCDSLTMWSHYADSHFGVCLTYQIDGDALADRYSSDSTDPYLVAIADVEYGRTYFTDWLVSGDLEDPIEGEPVTSAAAKTLVVKSSDWHYENEVRIIMSGPGPIELPRDALSQVLFGVRTTESSKRAIRAIAERRNPNINFGQCRFTDEFDFGLTFDDI